jgi:predicted nuclease of predicted toxin-antitoxin system
MKLFVDECLASSSVLVLETLGFEILRVEDILQFQVSDEEILEYSMMNEIPIITHDRRFGFLYVFSTQKPWTTVIVQVQSPHPQATNELIQKSLSQLDLDNESYRGKLIIINPNNIRVRSSER